MHGSSGKYITIHTYTSGQQHMRTFGEKNLFYSFLIDSAGTRSRLGVSARNGRKRPLRNYSDAFREPRVIRGALPLLWIQVCWTSCSCMHKYIYICLCLCVDEYTKLVFVCKLTICIYVSVNVKLYIEKRYIYT